MKFFFGIFSLFIVTIGARNAPKIEIFEIRENERGLQLKNLNSNPKNNQRADPLLKLLRGPKPENQAVKFAKQLLSKLKSLKGEDKTTRLGDDTHIYILNSDVLDDDSSEEVSLFVDKTRNDRAVSSNVDGNDLRDLVMQLLLPERKEQRKRKLRQTLPLRNPALRDSNVIVLDARPGSSNVKREIAIEDVIDPTGNYYS